MPAWFISRRMRLGWASSWSNCSDFRAFATTIRSTRFHKHSRLSAGVSLIGVQSSHCGSDDHSQKGNIIISRRSATFSASSRLFDLNSETKRQSSAIIAADVRRFSYLINTDEVFGTHKRLRRTRVPASFFETAGQISTGLRKTDQTRARDGLGRQGCALSSVYRRRSIRPDGRPPRNHNAAGPSLRTT
jgi:hypothetical protein